MVLLLLSVFGLALVALFPSNGNGISNHYGSSAPTAARFVLLNEEEGNNETKDNGDDKEKDLGGEEKDDGDEKREDEGSNETTDEGGNDDKNEGDKEKDMGTPFKCGTPLVKTNQTDFLLQEYSAWKKKWVKSVKGGMCVMRRPGDVSGNPKYENDCVSEGNGYGLLLSAYLDDKETFEGLWKFVLTY